MKIYVIGNPSVSRDRQPWLYLPQLKKKFPHLDFIPVDPNENFPPAGERDLALIDTVYGISRPLRFDLSDLERRRRTPVSPHDYDLLIHLLLLKKTRRIDRAVIFGVPAEEAVGQSRKLAGLIAAFCRSRSSLGNVRHRTYRGRKPE